MDGVLFHGERALPGAADFLSWLLRRPHRFVTNNPIRSPAEVVAHFRALGLPEPDVGAIITTAQATATWLADQQPGFRYFAIGAGDLHAALSAVGREDAAHADFVVVGEGPGLDYESLSIAINLVLKQGARLVSTNPDANVDAMVDGVHRVLPGGGALVAAVAVATGVQPTVIGKPNPLLFRLALASLGLQPGQCIMVGDRPDTDIAGALALGMRTALVRTGRFGVADALPESVHPDWDVADLAALIAAWKVSTDRPS
ncbi:MAG: HAD-IIA family hydrolase [Gammaproteobacteria bacterium]|nr:HAD-IIA family hydrolase [Gammaproteobacteria bacterium]